MPPVPVVSVEYRGYTAKELDEMDYLPGSDFSKQRLEKVMTTLSKRNTPFYDETYGLMDDYPVAKTHKVDRTYTVGDIDSQEPGSGARANGGKLELDLVPVRFWIRAWSIELSMEPELADILERLMLWQEGCDTALEAIIEYSGDLMLDAVKVLEFGAQKYKAWNWAKGMPWSVPTGCILRHAKAIVYGESTDPESGFEHMAHIICNVIMLAWYSEHYPDGDDRPPVRKQA